jgi:hypothetical protein
MIIETYKDIEILAGGLSYEGATSGTVNIDVNDPTIVYRIKTTGTPTMASNYAVATTGTPVKGNKVIIRYEATADFNGNTLTLMGLTIDEEYEAKKFDLISVYDGSAWVTTVQLDFDQTDIIRSKSLINDAVTSSKISNNAVTTAKILDGAVTADKLDSGITAIQIASGTITGADLLTAFTTPIEVIPAIGGSRFVPFYVNIVPLAGSGTPFATNTTLQLICDGVGTITPIAELDVLSLSGSNPSYTLPLVSPNVGDVQYQQSQPIAFTVKTGNPTGGTFDINYTILYYIP